MKKTMLLGVLLALILIFAGCSAQPVTTESPDVSQQPTFNYILVKEVDMFYLHKLESWSTNNGIVTFKCSVCGANIRVPEADVIMYDKITLDTAWSDYATVCGGDVSDWHELLD